MLLEVYDFIKTLLLEIHQLPITKLESETSVQYSNQINKKE